jgi:hypothetical protein
MRDRFRWLIGAALMGAAACGGDGGSGPAPGGDEGTRLAARFDQLADSVDREGWSPTAEALRHAAEIVRLTGHATPVTLTIDGNTRPFEAVAEQLDFPQIQCWWHADSTGMPPGDTVVVGPDTGLGATSGAPSGDPVTECTRVGTYSMRTLIAWEPERMAEVVRLVADLGSNQVDSTVPDVMTGLPASAAPDTAIPPAPGPPPGPGPVPPDTIGSGSGGSTGGGTGGGGGIDGPGYPGFMGEYLVDNEGIWFAVEGSQTNELVGSSSACTADQATIDWAEFRCQGSRFGYRFSMRLEPVQAIGGPPTPVPGGAGTDSLTTTDRGGGPQDEHTIEMARSEVDGVRLTVVSWAPPPAPVPPPGPPGPPSPGPVPQPGPLPPDSAGTGP